MRRLAICVALLAGVAVASAGVSNWQAWWVDNSPYDMAHTGWSWSSTALTWNQWERYVATDVDQSTGECSGTASEDPIIHIVKAVTNGSTFVWTDYHISVNGSPGVAYVPGSATSDRFLTKIESPPVNPWIIDFYAPTPVAIGDTVTFTFDVSIPAGIFNFGIDQMPTPEPASLLLLGLGGLLLRRR